MSCACRFARLAEEDAMIVTGIESLIEALKKAGFPV